MNDPKAPDHAYTEWPVIGHIEYDEEGRKIVRLPLSERLRAAVSSWDDEDEFGFSEEQWRKANPSINELRARAGLPPYDGSLGDHKHNLKETTND